MIRICLSIAKVDWKDTRFQWDDWQELKPKTPLGFVPILKIDGVDHVQSLSLIRYAGRLAGMYPQDDDPLQALMVDEVLESVNELMSIAPQRSMMTTSTTTTTTTTDPQEFETLRKEYQANTMTRYASFFESIIQRNSGGGGGVLSSSKVTIADLAIKIMVRSFSSGIWDHLDAQFFESYPGIMATTRLVDNFEPVIAYYAIHEN